MQSECKKTQQTPLSSKSFPIFFITQYNDDGEPVQVNLCKKCSDDLEEWLSEGEDNSEKYTI